jgi:WD40 repeat protein
MSAVGNLVSFLDVFTGQQTYLPGPRHGGIGSLAVHPSGDFIALAEVHESPMIYILSYPGLKIHRILRNGTTKAYSNLCFNKKGDKIASVGSNPGF